MAITQCLHPVLVLSRILLVQRRQVRDLYLALIRVTLVHRLVQDLNQRQTLPRRLLTYRDLQLPVV